MLGLFNKGKGKHTTDNGFYSLEDILKTCPDAFYYVVFGKRSNGKTYACLKRILDNYWDDGSEGIYLRREVEEIKGANGGRVFNGLVANGYIAKLTNGAWSGVTYYNRAFYLSKWDDDLAKEVKDSKPFCYAMALSEMLKYKSSQFPNVTTIVFDEFIIRNSGRSYLMDEFVTFANTISTIVRSSRKAKIFMIGNTVNMYNPYFSEMGLYKVKEMKQGDINEYQYGDSDLKVAVEYAEDLTAKHTHQGDVYFAFDNPKLKMITTGEWELPVYPRPSIKIEREDVKFRFFMICPDDNIVQGDVIEKDDNMFIHFHKKTGEIYDYDLIYSLEFNPSKHYAINPYKSFNQVTKVIAALLTREKVSFGSNMVGEQVRNYLLNANKFSFMNL
jgi:hypothetical protein